ncbi:9026_t:CDS:2 [Funneliformis geosporum]|uniref:11160_t:CDS:1 n=1 Tax=Funneliformis geosporum TaxID=1117311 RepID=A0A9W4SV49_9GLOM|nr:9026_t:CDS:2 [Funneliformis geosporum]CAI2181700.1 11160_t:CDS:2 [Funneliformis geosporum]
MVKAKTTGARRTTHRVTSLPRRLFYKTKRVIMTPIRKARTHTTGTTTAPTTTTRRKKPLFGGLTRRHKAPGTQPAHRTRNPKLFGFARRRKNPHHHTTANTTSPKTKLRALLHRRI